jgi:hypothetical protein
MIANMESISRRDEFRERGLLILMGLPNATSVNQEMDALYGAFKSATYARGEVILTERLRLKGLQNTARAAAVVAEEDDDNNNEEEDGEEPQSRGVTVSMGFEDLATVVNGKQGETIENRPFDNNFTNAKIRASWVKVGFVPFTRNCITHKKVRHERGQREKDVSLENVHNEYEFLVEDAMLHGLNAGVFDASIPVARPVERVEEEDDQVKKLLETKGAFSASAMWNVCGSRIGNASVVLRAQKEQLDLEAQKAEQVLKSKSEKRAKVLVNARKALHKHESLPATMTDKDWVDIIRWVLPESKAEGLLKDLRKKDTIIAKLQSLEKDWKSYIPPAAAI